MGKFSAATCIESNTTKGMDLICRDERKLERQLIEGLKKEGLAYPGGICPHLNFSDEHHFGRSVFFPNNPLCTLYSSKNKPPDPKVVAYLKWKVPGMKLTDDDTAVIGGLTFLLILFCVICSWLHLPSNRNMATAQNSQTGKQCCKLDLHLRTDTRLYYFTKSQATKGCGPFIVKFEVTIST